MAKTYSAGRPIEGAIREKIECYESDEAVFRLRCAGAAFCLGFACSMLCLSACIRSIICPSDRASGAAIVISRPLLFSIAVVADQLLPLVEDMRGESPNPIQDGKDSEVFLEDRIHFRAIENSLFRVFTEKPTENPGALVTQALDEDGLIECLPFTCRSTA